MGCTKSNICHSKKLKYEISNQENEFKIVLLGDKCVGKTSIVRRFQSNIFEEVYELTIGGTFLKKEIQLSKSNPINMCICDTGGEERYRTRLPLYYQGSHAALLVFDITNAASYKLIEYWISELQSLGGGNGILIYIVGNKSDQTDKRNVLKNKAEAEAKLNGFRYYETSAKSGEGIKEIFEDLAEKLQDRKLKFNYNGSKSTNQS